MRRSGSGGVSRQPPWNEQSLHPQRQLQWSGEEREGATNETHLGKRVAVGSGVRIRQGATSTPPRLPRIASLLNRSGSEGDRMEAAVSHVVGERLDDGGYPSARKRTRSVVERPAVQQRQHQLMSSSGIAAADLAVSGEGAPAWPPTRRDLAQYTALISQQQQQQQQTKVRQYAFAAGREPPSRLYSTPSASVSAPLGSTAYPPAAGSFAGDRVAALARGLGVAPSPPTSHNVHRHHIRAKRPTQFLQQGSQHSHQSAGGQMLTQHDVTERSALYLHQVDSHHIHEMHVSAEVPTTRRYRPPHPEAPRKRRSTSNNQPQSHPLQRLRDVYPVHNHVRTELERRPPFPLQSRYDPERSADVSKTSSSLVRSRDAAYAEPADLHMLGPHRHGNGREFTHSLPSLSARTSAADRRGKPTETAAATNRIAPAPSRCEDVEQREASPVTKLLLQSRELLEAKTLVRNRHDEIDWVATFLNVGFDSNSIFSLMCPLRKGRWKTEEEKYTLELLRLIESGTIPLCHGQSIRGFIGKKLHSDDMRVLKKLSNCKMFHFARLINPRLTPEECVDTSVPGAQQQLGRLEKLRGEFLRSVQLEALVAVRKYLSDSSLRDLLNARG
ncbi:hypothetical protein BBJ28_00010046 [Nothophytophthora sp. Chile5]|nr:hypothetical protein BBJ28_00010046 [Nothophytophthora sp. Chile5]